MKKIGLYIWIILLVGCENAGEYSYSSHDNFKALWKIIDEYYCFFEYKQIDWDEVYQRYNPQISDTMNQYQLFDKLGEMLNELKDGHTNLISSFNTSRYVDWYQDHPSNFYSDIQANYLGRPGDYHEEEGIVYRRLADDQVGYLYYASFVLGVGDGGLDDAFDYFKNCKGLVIDIRGNGGGSLSNSDRIASRFIEEKLLVGYIQHKTGKGHADFSDPYPIYLSPSSRAKWSNPVVVLTNRHCYSAANDFVQKMRMIPQVTILGDRTGGGSGFPFSSELPNGWSVRFSSSPMLDLNMNHTEFGIDPDIPVSFHGEDFQKGVDTLIEAAMKHILNQ